MIPYFSYSPEDVTDTANSASTTSYFPTSQNTAHSYDSISRLGPTDQHIPFDSPIHSHSAPNTPYQQHPAEPQSHPQLYSRPTLSPTSFFRSPYYSNFSGVYDHSSSLIRFDQPPVASSRSSVSTHRDEALEPLPPPPPLRPPSSSSNRDRGQRNGDNEVETERRVRGKRRQRSTSAVETGSSGSLLCRESVTNFEVSEEPSVEKADKSCKACRARKVRCSRDWPRCVRCIDKSIECSYGDLVPVSFLKNGKLEERIQLLEGEIRSCHPPCAADFSSFLAKLLDSEPNDKRRKRDLISSTLDAFYSSHGYRPPLRSFLSRRHSLVQTLDVLHPHDQVAVMLCCSIGAQTAMANQAFLGREALNDDRSNRIQVTAMQIYDKHELGCEDATREGLEMHLVGCLIFSWDESTRKRARGWLRNALSIYRDLLDVLPCFNSRVQLMKQFGLALLDLDSDLSSDSRTTPLISNGDLLLYFSIFPTSDELAPYLASSRFGKQGGPEVIDEAINVVYRWVVFSARWVAEQASPRGRVQSVSTSALSDIFSQITQVHTAIATLQNQLLLRPRSASQAEISQLDHQLRFLSLLNYQVDESIYRSHNLVDKRLSQPSLISTHDFSASTIWSIENRIVEGLKRAAFYFRLFSISRTPEECRYLVYSLDSLPTWIRFAIERFSSPPKESRNQLGLEFASYLLPTELDWIEHALEGVSKCDTAVEEDLKEFRSLRAAKEGRSRRGSRVDRSVTGLEFRDAIERVSAEVSESWM